MKKIKMVEKCIYIAYNFKTKLIDTAYPKVKEHELNVPVAI